MHPEPDDAVLPPPLPRAGRTLATTMFAWTVVVVVVVTLAPFRFRPPAAVHIEWHASAYELAVNAVLLAVPGFLFRAATGPNRDVYCTGPLLLGIAVSSAIELVQMAVPGRFASPIDIAANSAGCWFGAMAHDSVRRHLDPRLAGKLLLELPLMGIVYLLVPLLWFSGEAAAEDGRRLALTIPLGILGGGVLAAVWHHRLRPAGILGPNRIALVALVWFVAAAFPGLRHRPGMLLAGTVVVAAATRLFAVWPRFLRGEGQRFEVPVLRRLGVLYVVYLAVLAGWPWRGDIGAWHGEWTFPELGNPPRLGPLFRVVEYVAAFTFGGYLVAESRGRREERIPRTLAWTVLPFGAFATGLEMLRGYAPDYGASVLRPFFAMVGAGFGAVIYRQQLAAVREWIATRAAQAAACAHSDAADRSAAEGRGTPPEPGPAERAATGTAQVLAAAVEAAGVVPDETPPSPHPSPTAEPAPALPTDLPAQAELDDSSFRRAADCVESAPGGSGKSA